MSSKTEHQSIRLFENKFLESLTHVHPLIPLLLWAPIASYLLWRSVAVHELPAAGLLLTAVAGILVWTLTEYVLHRFAFHFPAKSKFGKWLVFLFHGNHHDDPKDKTRLVMPPSGSIPIMIALYFLFSLFVPAPWIEPFCAFFMIGYLIYDYIHYATHHFPMKNPVAKYIKHYHLKHHFSGEKGRYGVSSPLWDKVFGSAGSGN
ncbi:fatty acid hydroxylase [Halieaceae bacterium IMCC14734]|uniref:Fatty acid hydroxylase n=1 Tax=Candidatus Litorirhabdus singularis TaxID=2518993 RepID=A0ABT3TM84_9GAMM|nr:sterol desaturase family protein [Candidatus Litorirhabdus singularis]MCX2982442.1 fatty acid hydroxylase [Candidatus Litorirhabdus singularis]